MLYENHPCHGVNVDHRRVLIEQNLQPVIDRTGFAEQQDPTDGVQNKRRPEGGERGKVAEPAQRRVGAGHHPRNIPPINVANNALPIEK